MAVYTKPPKLVRAEIAQWIRKQRLMRDWSQEETSRRSGIKLSTLRRFEQSGLISLDRLLRLAAVLGVLQKFSALCEEPAHFDSTEVAEKSTRKRAPRARKALP